MSAEEMKSLVRYLLEEGVNKNFAVLEKHPGLQEIAPIMRVTAESSADAEVSFPVQIVEGDWVATRAVYTATNIAPLFDIPATNKRIIYEVLMFHQIIDGVIVKQHSQADIGGMMRQLREPQTA